VSRRKQRLKTLAGQRVLIRHQGCLWHLAEAWEKGLLVSTCGDTFRPGGWDEKRHLEERDLSPGGRILLCEECYDILQAEKVGEMMMETPTTIGLKELAEAWNVVKSGGAVRRGSSMEVKDV